VRRHCALARRLARRLASAPGVRVLNSVPLNQVIVTFGTGTLEECNQLTRAAVAELQADNICLAGGADWHRHFVLRLSLIAAPLVEEDVDRLAAAILAAWRRVQSCARQPPQAPSPHPAPSAAGTADTHSG
jgi:glutamate/tyrosine decarboxylase-like PLP-dependent enzyme